MIPPVHVACSLRPQSSTRDYRSQAATDVWDRGGARLRQFYFPETMLTESMLLAPRLNTVVNFTCVAAPPIRARQFDFRRMDEPKRARGARAPSGHRRRSATRRNPEV